MIRLQHQTGGSNILLAPTLQDVPVRGRLATPVPLGAFCQLLEDQLQMCIVIRD
jgi:hypothetical protein